MDPYKSLLSSASREHVKRSSALQSPLVGNVFLPAIQSPTRRVLGTSPSAASMQHLKVIEQCIQAENRREAQLSKCRSVRERRHWERKFHAQREHERALIEALVTPSAKSHELQLLDLDAEIEAPSIGRVMHAAASGNGRRDGSESDAGVGGLTSSVASPDRVFRKATASSTLTTSTSAKPHARKKFTLPECHGSPTKKVYPKQHHHRVVEAPATDSEAQAADYGSRRGIEGQESPPAQRRSPSRSASPVRSISMVSPKPKVSPPKSRLANGKQSLVNDRTAGERDRHMRATAKTRVPPLASLPKPQVPASPVKKGSGRGRTPQAASRKQTDGSDAERPDGMVLFDGARSFAEVQRLALEAGVATSSEAKGEEKETQTSGRAESTTHWATSAIESRGLPSDDEGCEKDTHGEDAAEKQRIVRPHSSPLLRSYSIVRSNGGGGEDSSSSADMDAKETLDAAFVAVESEAAVPVELQPYECEHEELVPEAENAEAEAGSGGPTDEGGDDVHLEGDGEREALFTRTLGEDEKTEAALETEPAMEEEELDGVNAHANDALLTPQTGEEEELDTDVAEVLFDLVDLVADAVEKEKRQVDVLTETTEPETTPSPPLTAPSRPSTAQSARSTALEAAIGPLIRVQALFRGHNTRRAFRLALYQEALRGGMLGAMPGTIQGASGWYQDPKSLIAYYFVVDAATGEWEQRRELHCRRLVLTPFDMRSELSSSSAAAII